MEREFCILIDSAIDVVIKYKVLPQYKCYDDRYMNIINELNSIKEAYNNETLFKHFFNLNEVHMVEHNIDCKDMISAIDRVDRYYIENIAEE